MLYATLAAAICRPSHSGSRREEVMIPGLSVHGEARGSLRL